MKLIAPTLALLLTTTCIADEATSLKPVPTDAGAVALAPANTRIDFVGTHKGPKPDPRKGGFAKFIGNATITGSELESIAFEIDTASLWTEIPKLTNHLKSPDFFDVREHPKARFASKRIEPAKKNGTFNVIGDLTLLGKSKEITVPTVVASASQGLALSAKVTVDRTDFGMNFGKAMVEEKVTIAVAIGRPTTGKP